MHTDNRACFFTQEPRFHSCINTGHQPHDGPASLSVISSIAHTAFLATLPSGWYELLSRHKICYYFITSYILSSDGDLIPHPHPTKSVFLNSSSVCFTWLTKAIPVPQRMLFFFLLYLCCPCPSNLEVNADHRTKGVSKVGSMDRLKVTAGSYNHSSIDQHSIMPSAKTACMNLFVAQVFWAFWQTGHQGIDLIV